MTDPEARNLVALIVQLWPKMEANPAILDLWLDKLRPYNFDKARAAIKSHRVECKYLNPAMLDVLGKLGTGSKKGGEHMTLLADRAHDLNMSASATAEQILSEFWARVGNETRRRRMTIGKYAFNRAINEIMHYLRAPFEDAAALAGNWIGEVCQGSIDDWSAEQEKQARSMERIRQYIDSGGSPAAYMKRAVGVGVGGAIPSLTQGAL